jgi:hypothetical protein
MNDLYSQSAPHGNRSPLDWAKGEGTNLAPGRFSIRVRIGEGGAAVEKTLFGRFAWTIVKLLEAGEHGISSIDEIGPRLSHYVWVLRHREGIAIQSIEEKHGGRFPGRHVRYKLKAKVSLLEGLADAA